MKFVDFSPPSVACARLPVHLASQYSCRTGLIILKDHPYGETGFLHAAGRFTAEMVLMPVN
ncbi:MAG: hypothetical protein ACK2UM_09865 [Anaerolineales bacterium]